MARHLNTLGLYFFRYRGGVTRRQGFGFVQEQILLVAAPCFALGGKQLAQVCGESLLQQIPFDGHGAQLILENLLLHTAGIALGDERIVLFGRDRSGWHRGIRPAMPNLVHPTRK